MYFDVEDWAAAGRPEDLDAWLRAVLGDDDLKRCSAVTLGEGYIDARLYVYDPAYPDSNIYLVDHDRGEAVTTVERFAAPEPPPRWIPHRAV